VTSPDLTRIYEEIVASRRPETRAGCVSPESLLDAVEHRLREAEQIAVINHALACPACRADLELLRSVAAARRPFRPRLPVSTGVLAAAAAVIIGVGLVLGRGRPSVPDDVLRGDRSLPAPVSPRGIVSAGDLAFVWRSVPGASSYELTVTTEGGTRIYQATTRDTTIAPPSGTALAAGDYYWIVRVTMPDGSSRTTLPIQFSRKAP
jgi:hypothetical protein